MYTAKSGSLRAIILALLLVLFAGYTFLAFEHDSSLLQNQSLSHFFFFAGLSVCLLFATFLSMISSTSMRDRAPLLDSCFITCAISLILSLMEIVNQNKTLDPNQYVYASTALNAILVYNLSQIMLSLLRVSGRWPSTIALISSITFISIALLSKHDLRQGGFSEMLLILGILAHLLLALIPFVLLILTYALPTTRLVPNDFKQSLEARFFSKDEAKDLKYTFYGIWLIELATFTVAMALYVTQFGGDTLSSTSDPHFPISQVHLSWIPLILLSLVILREEASLNQQNSNLSALVSRQAKRFLQRYHHNHRNWATTVGMRTANYMIDHDPNEDAKAVLPSYMVRIRQSQIQLMCRDLLGDILMDDRVVANQIYGTIDPESSIRCCTDVLLLFTAVYIDGIPMVESRLKNLVRLFPILDAELASKITTDIIENSLGKIQWFFHVDFDWVDQHMITTDYKADYNVSIDNLRLRDRQRILGFLQEHNLMGNFIWVGEKARERIILEAPYLSNIIEAWPIKIKESDDREVDSVIFLIKFEQLIPRMQKYFNLEEVRKKLRYYDPSLESRRMLNIIDLEIEQSNSQKDIWDILSLINNYPWQGFKEKDLALELVLKSYERFQDREPKNQIKDKILERFVDTIQNIGYPSQEIHAAHLDKMRIRQADSISKTCLSRSHPRFNEAWLLMATTSTRNFSNEELIILLGTIEKAIKDKVIRKKPIVIKKASEAFFNVSQEMSNQHINIINQVANSIVQFLIEMNANPDQFCFFMDAKIFLETNLKESVSLHTETLNQMQAYFAQLYDRYGSDSSTVISLSSRWRILMNQAKPNQNSETAS